MWRALFIGWLAVALAEEVAKDTEATGLAKRQTARGNTVVYGASPGQYTLQTPDRVAAHAQQQVSADYQQQSELYVISPNRKPTASALTYSSETPRRPQYIQLSPLQLQAAQQALQHQQLQQQQPGQQQVTYETEAGHGAFYRPSVRVQPQPEPRQQEPTPAASPVQYAASAVVDSQLYPQAGSFERELAQLVAANRAQEQKYNSAAGLGAAGLGASSLRKQSAPQQYLKEVTRPAPRPLAPARLAPAPQPASAAHGQYQPLSQQPQQLYRYVYQPEQLQQIQSTSPQQYKQSPEPQYTRPQVQQYIQPQPQPQSQIAAHAAHAQALRLRNEEDAQAQVQAQAQARLRAHSHGLSSARLAAAAAAAQAQPEVPSRSTIYVSQATPLKKPAYSLPPANVAERDEEEPAKVPTVRIPTQRNRPLTQDEFQSILQSGGYTATLVPSNDPSSPHQEYLLHPTGAQTAQRPVYSNEKQEAVTYLLPQAHQRPVKRRPVYNVQQA